MARTLNAVVPKSKFPDSFYKNVSSSLNSRHIYSIRKTIKEGTRREVSIPFIRTVMMGNGCEGEARLYTRLSRVQLHTIDFVLTRESSFQDRKVFVSLDRIPFANNGGPVYGYSNRGRTAVYNEETKTSMTTASVLVEKLSCGLVFIADRSGSFSTLYFVEAVFADPPSHILASCSQTRALSITYLGQGHRRNVWCFKLYSEEQLRCKCRTLRYLGNAKLGLSRTGAACSRCKLDSSMLLLWVLPCTRNSRAASQLGPHLWTHASLLLTRAGNLADAEHFGLDLQNELRKQSALKSNLFRCRIASRTAPGTQPVSASLPGSLDALWASYWANAPNTRCMTRRKDIAQRAWTRHSGGPQVTLDLEAPFSISRWIMPDVNENIYDVGAWVHHRNHNL
jgi:hypothetical protein